MNTAEHVVMQEEDCIANSLAFIMCEVSPCDGCDHHSQCADGMACSVFFHYVQTGSIDRENYNGTPTAARYRRLFWANAS